MNPLPCETGDPFEFIETIIRTASSNFLVSCEDSTGAFAVLPTVWWDSSGFFNDKTRTVIANSNTANTISGTRARTQILDLDVGILLGGL
jgi:hypothetical protein